MSQNPQDAPLDKIHHIAVTVPNITEAVDWYTQNFRCHIDYIDETWALLDFANTKLALVLPDQHPPHFGVVRSDAEKFGHLIKHRDGIASIYIKDLAGNSLEILQERDIDSNSD